MCCLFYFVIAEQFLQFFHKKRLNERKITNFFCSFGFCSFFWSFGVMILAKQRTYRSSRSCFRPFAGISTYSPLLYVQSLSSPKPLEVKCLCIYSLLNYNYEEMRWNYGRYRGKTEIRLNEFFHSANFKLSCVSIYRF